MMSDKALTCPNCGASNTIIRQENSRIRQGKMLFVTLATVAVLVSIAFFSYHFFSKSEKTGVVTVVNTPNMTQSKETQEVENKQDEIAKQKEEMQRQKEMEELRVAEQKKQEQLKWQRYLKGQWIRSGIDPTMVEIVYWVFTFRDDGYNFTYGSEYTYNSSSKFYPYYVEGNIIYTAENKPLLRIDESNRQLISCETPDEVYSKR